MPLSLAHVLDRAAREYEHCPALRRPGGETRTYGELLVAADHVAHTLVDAGVKRGDRVGLLVPKSLESIASVWGTLRGGAAYVPLDPTAPPNRAAFIAKNCGMAAVVASSDLRPQVEAIGGAIDTRIIQVHGSGRLSGAADARSIWTAPRAGLPRDAMPNARDLAYILYTSGSTGTPKGVMVSHGAALSFPEWAAAHFALHHDDRVSSHAPLHFDLSTFDLFASALAGACVVVLDEEIVRFPVAASQVMEAERITVWYSVPGALRAMLRAGRLATRDLNALRVVLFAGEVYPADELRTLQRALPHVLLANLYGPTETNVCTWWQVPPPGQWTEALIGRECENCEGIVVDEQLVPVPDGVAGELLVRGGTLMEGYWGDPERTARTLIPDGIHPHLSDRLYRTGDIVTRGPDGNYVFHGRRDHMVKIRGYRVELGEVEAALHAAPNVAAAAVVACERTRETGAETSLVAFLVPADGQVSDPATARARNAVVERLPKYMIPAEFRWIPELPVTSTGKVNRVALAALVDQHVEEHATGDLAYGRG